MDMILAVIVALYGNFNTMGVTAGCPEGMRADQVGRVRAYMVEGDGRRAIHDLVRVGATEHFAGSIFHLEPDSEYTVEVEVYDRGGKLVAKGRATGKTRIEPEAPEAQKAIYVSLSGSDEDPGSIERPLGSLKAALAKAVPGTTIFLREGVYHTGSLSAANSGTVNAPIAIRSYEGERVVLDGSDEVLETMRWSGKDGIYSAPFEGQTWNVTCEEEATGKYYRLYPLRTMKELTERRSDGKTFEELGFTGAYHCDGKMIHIVPPGEGRAEYIPHVSRHTEAMTLEGKGKYVFEGLEFRHYGRGDYGRALFFLDSSGNLVKNCRVYYCNSGIYVKGASNNNTIEDSVFVDDVAHWHFSYMKNDVGWAYHGQVETGAVTTDGRYTGRGMVFRRNRIEGYFDGAHLGPWVEVNEVTSETDFYGNVMYDIGDDFLETDGYSRNVRIFDNVMDRSLSGISLAQALDGPTFIVGNVLANCGVCKATSDPADYEYEGYPYKTNGGSGADIGSGPVFFYHNTSWTSDPKSRAMLVKGAKWRFFVFRNNIWCGKAMGFDVWRETMSPTDWDYDDLYHEAGPFMKMRGHETMETIEDARKALGVMEHGISADPEFVDAEGGDFHLEGTSPCIDAGEVIEGINDGSFKGEGPDMGAFEVR